MHKTCCHPAERAASDLLGDCRLHTSCGCVAIPRACPLRSAASVPYSQPRMLKGLLQVLQVLLAAVVPLLERRVQAAERQAASQEQLYLLLRQYLGYADPDFRRVLEGALTAEQEAQGLPADVYHEEGVLRDQKLARMEELRALWFNQHGEVLDDERLMVEYDRLYTEAANRVAQLDPDQRAEVHP